MTIAVKIESPVGTTIQTRNFQPGQQVRVGGHVIGGLGIAAAFQPARMELTGDAFYPLFADTLTNFFGDFWFDITMPFTMGKASLRLSTTFPFFGQTETEDVPIAIGDVYPDPVPSPPPEGRAPTLPKLPKLDLDVDWNIIGIAGLIILGIILTRRR